MEPLRWTWDVRLGPYARGAAAAQPLTLVVAPLVGFATAFLLGRRLSIETRIGAGVVLTVLVVLLWLAMLSRQLRRRRSTARARSQSYELGPEALTLSVGRDSYTLPTADLTVSARGRDWLAVRRRATGRRPLLLFFDDPSLVGQAEAVVATYGADGSVRPLGDPRGGFG